MTSVKGTSIVCNNESGDMYASIDLVVDTIDQQVRRTKGAEHDRRHR